MTTSTTNGHAVETTAGIMGAVLAARSEMPTLRRDAVNPHFKSKYMSLDGLVEAVRPVLAKHALVWTSYPTTTQDGVPALRYRLSHVPSGESVEDVMPLLLAKNDPQGQGSAITYARRYALCSVLNLVADEDDDGAAATVSEQGEVAAKPATITAKRAKELADTAFAVGVEDKLQLAASHALGRDVGDCSTAAAAAKALGALTVAAADKVDAWVSRKADEGAGDE